MLETKLEQESKNESLEYSISQKIDELIKSPYKRLSSLQPHIESIYWGLKGTSYERRFSQIYAMYNEGDIFDSREELNEQLINFKRNNLRY